MLLQLMATSRKVLCVATPKPSSAAAVGGAAGGSLVLVCPRSGSVQSSLRVAAEMSGSVALGLNTVSSFPASFSGEGNILALGYGSNSNAVDDSYGVLLTLRTGTAPPLVHWRCRLPESQMTAGLTVSPCGHYIVGGGSSGNIYIWKSMGGHLIKSLKAHYRSVTVLAWLPCGRFLLTGGSDGMVHAYSLIDLTNTEQTLLQPIRTWTKHTLAITAITPLSGGGRLAASSEDGQVILLEIFSGVILAVLQLPEPIHALVTKRNRLLCGGRTIYVIDLDEYAIHQTQQMGASVIQHNSSRLHDQVFGSVKQQETSSSGDGHTASSSSTDKPYVSELRGHDRFVTSLAIWESYDDDDRTGVTPGECLVSGDESGILRVWDLESRSSIRTMHPWSTSFKAATTASHRISSVMVIDQDPESTIGTTGGMFSTATENYSKNGSMVHQLIQPLQKFPSNDRGDNRGDITIHGGGGGGGVTNLRVDSLPVPFLRPSRGSDDTGMDHSYFSWTASLQKRRRRNDAAGRRATESTQPSSLALSSTPDESKRQWNEAEVSQLRKELDEARATIQRWENVNNKLMARLRETQGS